MDGPNGEALHASLPEDLSDLGNTSWGLAMEDLDISKWTEGLMD